LFGSDFVFPLVKENRLSLTSGGLCCIIEEASLTGGRVGLRSVPLADVQSKEYFILLIRTEKKKKKKGEKLFARIISFEHRRREKDVCERKETFIRSNWRSLLGEGAGEKKGEKRASTRILSIGGKKGEAEYGELFPAPAGKGGRKGAY